MELFTSAPGLQSPFSESAIAALQPTTPLQDSSLLRFQGAAANPSNTPFSEIQRVSVSSSGNPGNSSSRSPSISADGRYVAFQSYADNLVAGDTNDTSDIFVYDTQLKSIRRVSVDVNGNQGNFYVSNPSISGDGRYVTFESAASNLVTGDTNNTSDIFVYDTQLSSIRRVSVDVNGNQGNGYSFSSNISADGRYVTFTSYANNLVAGDTNDTSDIFVYDTQMSSIRRVSVDVNGNQGNLKSLNSSISADGQYVTFDSHANNLVAGDTNNVYDIFVYNNSTQQYSSRLCGCKWQSGELQLPQF
jgi:tricorn protease-like protein